MMARTMAGMRRLTEKEKRAERAQYFRRAEHMSDREIKNKLCENSPGCLTCGVLDRCRYGQEAQKRGML